jgi:hypothetical protein
MWRISRKASRVSFLTRTTGYFLVYGVKEEGRVGLEKKPR